MFFYNSEYNLSLTDYGIEVPMLDVRILKLREWIEKYHPGRIIDPQSLGQFDEQDLLLVHDQQYVDLLHHHPQKAIADTYEIINPDGSFHRYNPQNAKKSLESIKDSFYQHMHGSYQAAKFALLNGFSFNLGGGFHHAMSFAGRGFCLLNDIVYSAKKLMIEDKVDHIWIIDVDAHKGDGTAQLCQNNPNIHTLSIHMKDGWPLDGSKYDGEGKLHAWFIPSDIDIEIATGEEEFYLTQLEAGLKKMQDKFNQPDIVLIVQGSDPYEYDGLEGSQFLKLTSKQMLQRDQLVYHFFNKLNVPQCYLMSGGYGDRAHEIYIQFLHSIQDDLNCL